MTKILNSAEKYILLATLFLLPLAFLPVFPNPFDTPKLIILALGISLLTLILALEIYFSGNLKYSRASFDIPVAALSGAYLLSSMLAAPNKMEAFFLPGVASTVILGGLIYFLANKILPSDKKPLARTLFLSALTLSLAILFANTGIFGKIPQLPSFVKDASFTLTGGNLSSAIFLAIVLPLGISLFLEESQLAKKLFWAVSLLINLLGLGLSVVNLLPGKPTSLTLPSYQTSWAVAANALGQSPVLGVGPGNFLSAFNQFRPVSYNATPLWQARFATATNFLFTAVAEVGLAGVFAIILLFLAVAKTFNKNIAQSPFWEASLLFACLSLLVLPANLTSLVILFILLSLTSESRPASISLIPTSLPALLVALPVALAVILFWFFGARVTLAEYKFQRAIDAISQNNSQRVFGETAGAIKTNPYVDRYHSLSSQIDMAAARNLSQKKDLTDTDKNAIGELIGAAIAEGKAVVALNPTRSQNWALLAGIYSAVMPFASGADTFAVQTYSQAIALDPTDPTLRISLGGVYYALGRYDDAISTFQLATYAKADLANAHYNLAIAYREKGDIDQAIAEAKATLSLVPKDSNDYKLAQDTLSDLEKRKTTTSAKEGENLTAPQKVTPAIKPPLELPSEATPPASP